MEPLGDDHPLSLYWKRLNTWTGRLKGDEQPFEFQHWTKHGTLRMVPSYPAGILHCSLMLNETFIGAFSTPRSAAFQAGSGKLDKEFGFEAKAVGVPEDLSDWSLS